jgi:RNA polymerase sigma-70 factor (ECF subfamily)
MSAPPQGRLLPRLTLWEKDRTRADAEPAAARLPQPTDEELMSRLQAHDSRALDLLYDRYARLFFRIALNTLQDYAEAEDVVQEVFIYLFQKAAVFDPSKGGARSWLVQVAFHRALNRRMHLDRRGFYLGTEIESLVDTLLGETDSEREIGTKLNRAQLEKAFKELPEMQRRTLELFYFKGFDLREISVELNEPLTNIRHHYYRGLQRLRKSAIVQSLREK